ncbi:hypothetical protein EJB05_03799, partial [Eragrostis curvula]
MALNAASKMNYLACVHILALLSQHFDPPRTGTSTGRSSQLPRVDVFINTVDPVVKPILYTMNRQLPCVDVSILATEYPLDRHATRPTSLTTAGRWSTIYHEALQETAKFAALWKPFCQQHRVEPRVPKSYFAAKVADGPHAGDSLRVHCHRSRGGSRQSRPTSGADLRTALGGCTNSIATEDVPCVLGHGARHALINLTEQQYQILRCSGGSLDMFMPRAPRRPHIHVPVRRRRHDGDQWVGGAHAAGLGPERAVLRT